MSGQFNFDDLEPAQEDFNWKGKKYWVVEASADAARRYKNAQIEVAKFNQEGKFSGAGKLADSEHILVAGCVYLANKEGELPLVKVGEEMLPDQRFRVPENLVLTWPNRIQSELYDWIKEHSNLKEEETEDFLIDRITKDTEKLEKLRESQAVSLQKKLPKLIKSTSSIVGSTEESNSTDSLVGAGH